MSAFNTVMIDFSFGSANILWDLLIIGLGLGVVLLFLIMFVPKYIFLIGYTFYAVFVWFVLTVLAIPFSNDEQIRHYTKYGKAFNQELEQCLNMGLKNEQRINECFHLKVKQKKETMLRQDNANPETIKHENAKKVKQNELEKAK